MFIRLVFFKVSARHACARCGTGGSLPEEKKEALRNGPGLRDFVCGELADSSAWAGYAGALKRQKGER